MVFCGVETGDMICTMLQICRWESKRRKGKRETYDEKVMPICFTEVQSHRPFRSFSFSCRHYLPRMTAFNSMQPVPYQHR
jgi:hypothetical protein